jgi:hypothetical protein
MPVFYHGFSHFCAKALYGDEAGETPRTSRYSMNAPLAFSHPMYSICLPRWLRLASDGHKDT